jgi:hypothetical protein
MRQHSRRLGAHQLWRAHQEKFAEAWCNFWIAGGKDNTFTPLLVEVFGMVI